MDTDSAGPSAAWEKMREQLVCSICLEVFDGEVARVKCCHYFCRECISSYMSTVDEESKERRKRGKEGRSKACPCCKHPIRPRDLERDPKMESIAANFRRIQNQISESPRTTLRALMPAKQPTGAAAASPSKAGAMPAKDRPRASPREPQPGGDARPTLCENVDPESTPPPPPHAAATPAACDDAPSAPSSEQRAAPAKRASKAASQASQRRNKAAKSTPAAKGKPASQRAAATPSRAAGRASRAAADTPVRSQAGSRSHRRRAWTCSTCTFADNATDRGTCKVCGAPRGVAPDAKALKAQEAAMRNAGASPAPAAPSGGTRGNSAKKSQRSSSRDASGSQPPAKKQRAQAGSKPTKAARERAEAQVAPSAEEMSQPQSIALIPATPCPSAQVDGAGSEGLAQRGWVIVPSSLSSAEAAEVEQLASLCGGRVVDRWDSDTRPTHVVCGAGPAGRPKRTVKVVLGVLSGCWIVTNQWVSECLKNGAYVPEEAFLCPGAPVPDPASDGPPGASLLAGWHLHVAGTFKGRLKEDLVRIAEAAGATVHARAPLVDGGEHGDEQAVLYDPDAVDDRDRRMIEKHAQCGLRTLGYKWMMDSCMQLEVQDVAQYLGEV